MGRQMASLSKVCDVVSGAFNRVPDSSAVKGKDILPYGYAIGLATREQEGRAKL